MTIIEGEEVNLPWPTVFSAVDVGVRNPLRGEWLLGRKPGQDLWRFPGGFCMPGDHEDSWDASRELREETRLMIHPTELRFVGRVPVDDPRYQDTPHSVRTSLFFGSYTGGVVPVAQDDLEEVRWVDETQLLTQPADYFVSAHRPLWVKMMQTIGPMKQFWS